MFNRPAACRSGLFSEIAEERLRQERKWGQQNHTPMHWVPILVEEVGEVAKTALETHFQNEYPQYQKHTDYAEFRKELIQVAAVAVAMIESHDRNNSAQ